MLTIKIAGRDEAELIADMSRATFLESFGAQNSKENMDKFLREQFTRANLLREVGAVGNIFLLAYLEQEPVGYARMRENNKPPEIGHTPALEIARLYAIAPAIGKGVGSALMQSCINIAEEKNYPLVWLGVWEHNHRAIQFYTKWGFEKFAEHPFVLGDDVQTDWLMKKRVRRSEGREVETSKVKRET